MIMRRICIILINELAKVQASRLSEQFKIAGEAKNNSKFKIQNSKFLILWRFAKDNICIPDAQYCELNAQRNLWCEILEF